MKYIIILLSLLVLSCDKEQEEIQEVYVTKHILDVEVTRNTSHLESVRINGIKKNGDVVTLEEFYSNSDWVHFEDIELSKNLVVYNIEITYNGYHTGSVTYELLKYSSDGSIDIVEHMIDVGFNSSIFETTYTSDGTVITLTRDLYY